MITILTACGRYGEIGQSGELPWHIPEDMEFFKRITKNHVVIMGYKTWLSLPKRPLKGRINIVITKEHLDEFYLNKDSSVVGVNSLAGAISFACNYYSNKQIFIIGGGQIYDLAVKYNVANRIIVTHVDAEYPDADTFFPLSQIEDKYLYSVSLEYNEEQPSYSRKIYRLKI